MKPLLTVVSVMALTASAWAAKPAANQGPLPKNLAAPTYRAPVNPVAAQEFTEKDAKRLAATAESAADHMKLASYYSGEAEVLDATGAAYEQAATSLRAHPLPKNLAAPGTAARLHATGSSARPSNTAAAPTAARRPSSAATSTSGGSLPRPAPPPSTTPAR